MYCSASISDLHELLAVDDTLLQNIKFRQFEVVLR